MRVTILTHTPEPEKTVAAAARLCYSNTGPLEIMESLSEEKVTSFIQKLQKSGHMSPFEHVSFTFAIEGVSRTLLAQLTRHRIASYSVQSLRYNNPFKDELNDDEKDFLAKVKKENRAYLNGFVSAGGDATLFEKESKKPDAGENVPSEVQLENLSHFLRGVFDAAGKIKEEGLLLSFPEKFSRILSGTSFKFEVKDNYLVLSEKDTLDFCLYIYGGIDFAHSLYLKQKFVELCRNSRDFFDKIKKHARDYIKARYYCVLPEEIEKNPEAILAYIDALENCKKTYLAMVKMGVDKEDARYILPMGTCTNLVVTMNARSLYNFFHLRCCERAQSEIRQLARMMLDEVRKIAPNLFKKAGAPCEATGYCPEGAFSCGKYPVRN
ncbi:MAG: thymidylate synthase [Tepidanaerobacteraceae bacterium]|nr:thymidylate synthase [Tepidanaerobacteraceae bacterium]